MKAQDLVTIKQMSAETVDSFPDHLTMDGKGNVFTDGETLHLSSLLKLVEEARDSAVALNKVIQSLEGRKAKA